MYNLLMMVDGRKEKSKYGGIVESEVVLGAE